MSSDELKNAFAEAMQKNSAESFLKANGCEAAKEELKAFLLEKQNELTEEELAEEQEMADSQDFGMKMQ